LKFIWLQHWKLLRSSTYTKIMPFSRKRSTVVLYCCKRNTKLCISFFSSRTFLKNSKKVTFWVQQFLDRSRILPEVKCKMENLIDWHLWWNWNFSHASTRWELSEDFLLFSLFWKGTDLNWICLHRIELLGNFILKFFFCLNDDLILDMDSDLLG